MNTVRFFRTNRSNCGPEAAAQCLTAGGRERTCGYRGAPVRAPRLEAAFGAGSSAGAWRETAEDERSVWSSFRYIPHCDDATAASDS